MLWNWNVKDACFLASGWQITNGGMMAASCIGVALLVVVLEVMRLMGKKLDALMLAQMQRRGKAVLAASLRTPDEDGRALRQSCRPEVTTSGPRRKIIMRVSPVQQVLRAILYAGTFAIAYILMLILMSYNGYLICSVVIGAGLGKFLTDWLSCTIYAENEEEEKKAEGIEELTVCCQ